jgi:hypothetical protein
MAGGTLESSSPEVPPRMTRRSWLLTLAVTAGLASSTIAVIGSPAPVAAASYTFHVDGPVDGRIGVDAIYQNGGGGGEYDIRTCNSNGSNVPILGWDSAGNLVGTTSVPDSKYGSLTSVRFELYPGQCPHSTSTYNAFWDLPAGGVHFETGAGSRNLGTVTLPSAASGAFRIDGPILSSTPISDGRVHVDAFQATTAYPDPPAPLQSNGVVNWGAFSSASSRGATWTGSWGWAGRYILFVEDRATGTRISAAVDISRGAIPTIDLDAICFGFDTCEYGAGGPGTTAGTFHPTSPTRIIDTRIFQGITNGALRPGTGRNSSPDPLTRRDEIANREIKVTGLAGIPTSGVSAVLLNVTADQVPEPGYLSVFPKPQACCGGMSIYDDQATLLTGEPQTSNLNVTGGQTVPNMVLARVGAGGKIRFYNYAGDVHLIVDVAGWFGTGGAHTNGSGFTGVTPSRLLDSRNAIGGPKRPFAAGETRLLKVAGVGGVPSNAASVVVNITAANTTGWGYTTAFPAGSAVPTASNLNYRAGDVRANLAVVRIGDNGSIGLHAAESATDLIVDVLGSFGPGGGRVTAITPVRLADSRSALRVPAGPIGGGNTVKVQVRGEAGVPGNATAVIANVTAAGAHGFGFFTVFPTGVTAPSSSNVNFQWAGQNVPNLVMVKLGTDGSVTVRGGEAPADLIVDVFGYVT